MQKYVTLTNNIETRIKYFQNFRIKRRDSEHLALAEITADVFLTTDDDLLKIAMIADTMIKVTNPLSWLQRRII